MNKILSVFGLVMLLFVTACDDDDAPAAENEEEVIDQVVLFFIPVNGTGNILVEANDDGTGFVMGTIELESNTDYNMEIRLLNSANGEIISDEVAEEDDEHMFFFEWTDGLFSDPAGNGNIGAGNRNDDVNYNDEDDNGYPVGLSTNWTTGDANSGSFRIMLKHQPGTKSGDSDSTVGGTDVNLTFPVTIN